MRPDRTARLRPLLDELLDPSFARQRLESDPVRFPRRYRRPEDVELVGLVAACLAYGRADLFLPKLEQLFAAMGDNPSQFARKFDPRRDGQWLRDFVYRFNTGADLAALLLAAGRLQNEGGLGEAFAAAWRARGELKGALCDFTAALRSRVAAEECAPAGALRAFEHLLPDPARGGACKRLLLYLRWMIRGGPEDPIDLRIWRQLDPAVLLVPVDTHVARIGWNLGLTHRDDLSWRTSEEITASLRQLDPADPVKYDFALCHLGMSGRCPVRRSPSACRRCPLSELCRGRRRPRD